MKAKHTFKYTYEESCEDFSPLDVTFEVPGDVTITQMLYNFQCYLRACGFVFEGSLEIIDPEGLNDLDWEDENGLSTTSSSLEVEKNKWVHGMCNPPSPDWEKQKNKWYHNE